MGIQLSRVNRRDFNAWLGLIGLFSGNFSAIAAEKKSSHKRSILVVGDSLSAEYGLRRGTGWVALLQQRLEQQKISANIINASISGDTSSGGRSRLAALLAEHQPSHLILELGGNDALRGLPLSMTQENLSAMVSAAQKTKTKVLLIGMQVPPNYGADYAKQFATLFETIAQNSKSSLVPFFLKGIADDKDALKYFQADRIHPKEEAQSMMLDNVWPTLKKIL